MGWIFLIAFAGLVVYIAVGKAAEGASPSEVIVCPHCRTKGYVHARRVVRKQGISGGKATGAFFTAGLSMLATGLSRKQRVTHMTCSNCGTEWDVY
jgi:DNA-directed RNA polymerase subunit RPC12/RpoP